MNSAAEARVVELVRMLTEITIALNLIAVEIEQYSEKRAEEEYSRYKQASNY